jgi:nicotinamide riboside kinase
LPDLPWKADAVRENGTRRRYLLNRYQSNLEYYGIPFQKIAGKGSLRLKRAQKHVNALIEKSYE